VNKRCGICQMLKQSLKDFTSK